MCSTKKQRQETTVTEYLNYPVRIYPIGRLDKESEGLLLLTNQGDLVNKIMRAGNYHEKEYLVTVNKPVDGDFVKKCHLEFLFWIPLPVRVLWKKQGEILFGLFSPRD